MAKADLHAAVKKDQKHCQERQGASQARTPGSRTAEQATSDRQAHTGLHRAPRILGDEPSLTQASEVD